MVRKHSKIASEEKKEIARLVCNKLGTEEKLQKQIQAGKDILAKKDAFVLRLYEPF